MAQIETAKESKRVVVDLTMTVEEARQVIWQDLYHPREPIGKLLDSKQIKYGNLCWAVDGAPAQEMRAAARTLLANWLGQPDTLEVTRRFGPEVIEGSHYLEEQQEDSLTNSAAYFVGGVVGLFFIVWNLIQQIVSNKTGPLPPSVIILGNFIGIGVLAIWLYRKVKRELENYRSARRGRKGEEAVVEKLRTILDNRWIIFRNLHLPDRKDDIDIALVGPSGVWALEVKAFRETVRVANGAWERQTKRSWKKLDRNPSQQARENAVRLNRFLQQQGINRWIEKAVVLSEPQAISNFEHTDDVWILPQIESKVTNLSTRTPPTDDEIKRITGLFRELASKQVAIEEAKYKKS